MISEGDMNLLREVQSDFMPDSVIQMRRVLLADELEPTTINMDLKCRYFAGYGFWRLVADRFQGITPYTFTFPYGSDVQPGDELIDTKSHTYQVRDVKDPSSYQTAVIALADQVN